MFRVRLAPIALVLALFQVEVQPSWAATPISEQVRDALRGAVHYLDQTQQKETVGDAYFSGEWSSTMITEKAVPLIGNAGKQAYDSNSFTVSSIHNSLAAVYLRQPWLTSIPEVLDRSVERILSYRNGEGFNFWPLLDAYPPAPDEPGLKVRRPNHFLFTRPTVAAGCNVFNDSDDTAVAFTALQLYAKIRPEAGLDLPQNVGSLFSRYRDVNRPIPHFYNLGRGMVHTGAFMTWLEDEHPKDLKTYLPEVGRTYIPFGLNDVDCVVNANVLATLARFSELDTAGAAQACEFVEWSFKTGRQHTCGVYYPSPYNLHYVVAKAYDAGATCLKGALDMAVKEILSKQKADGLWKSDIKGDSVHTSLYALNTLLYASKSEASSELQSPIERAIRAILASKIARVDSSYAWPEGIFFSGGTIARHRIYWKSEPYTTSLAADALSLYLEIRSGN